MVLKQEVRADWQKFVLTFENTRDLLPTEFNVVTITRKFYKNGESEYRLKTMSVSLKGYSKLILDTGWF
jgi:chromosome segregation protein